MCRVKLYGPWHLNRVLRCLPNTLVYDVRFLYGVFKKNVVNIIADNVLSQVDPDWFYMNDVSHVLDHKRDGTTVPMSQNYIRTKSGQQRQHQTTTGRSFQVK